jgi:hypothetical protein
MMAGLGITGSQDFTTGKGAQVRLSRDLRMVVTRATLGVARATCCEVLLL